MSRMNDEKGAVLVPVLLLSSIVTIGMLIILQTQLIQKKSVENFKVFLKEKKENQKELTRLQRLELDQLFLLKNIKLVQKEPMTMHYNETAYRFCFQTQKRDYFCKKNITEVAFKETREFSYKDSIFTLIQRVENKKHVLYIYDTIKDQILFEKSFSKKPYVQLVGDPVDSLYIHDKENLFKLDLKNNDPSKIDRLYQFSCFYNTLADFPPQITRDPRGDGRLITVLTHEQPMVYHESSKNKEPFLDLFDHYYFS